MENHQQLIELKEKLEELLIIEKARKSFSTFCEYVFGLKLGQIHKEWFKLAKKGLETKQPVVIFAPRGHAKTTILSVCWPIFLLGHNPNLRIKLVSHGDKKSADILRQIKEAIETNERLHQVFPNLQPGATWSANKIIVKRDIWSKDVTIEALGVLSGATGGRADYIIFDDIVEFNNTLKYPSLIKTVRDAFYSNWLNLLEPNSYGWLLVGTIWTKSDLHYELLQKPLPLKKVYRIDPETLEPIWPEYWTKEKILERYNTMPKQAFYRAFCNIPLSLEETLFKREDIEKNIIYNDPRSYIEKCKVIVAGLDLALSTKKESSNTALVVCGLVRENNKIVVLHSEYGKFSAPEVVNLLQKAVENWKVDLVLVESNQYQGSLVQWIQEMNLDIPIKSIYTTANKNNIEAGLPSLAIDLKNFKIGFLMSKKPHSSNCQCGMCKLLEELEVYPFGATDDLVMALYFCRDYLSKQTSFTKAKNNVIIETWKPSFGLGKYFISEDNY
ncbi:MAG: hypothetical protein QXT86_11555 [Archaeoglobaceae archaeon]